MTRNNVLLSGSLGHPFQSNVNLQNVLVTAKRQFYVADTETNKQTTKKHKKKQIQQTQATHLSYQNPLSGSLLILLATKLILHL